MGRTTVSSSIFRGGSATTKMPKMAFTSFGRRTNPNNLPNKTDFEETLIETNNLLRDISNQIAADFAYRIAALLDFIYFNVTSLTRFLTKSIWALSLDNFSFNTFSAISTESDAT